MHVILNATKDANSALKDFYSIVAPGSKNPHGLSNSEAFPTAFLREVYKVFYPNADKKSGAALNWETFCKKKKTTSKVTLFLTGASAIM